MNVRVANVRTRLKRIVVVRSCFENQTLIGLAVFDMKHLALQGIVVAHLVAGDVVKTSLSISVAVVSVFVAVSGGLHPKGAIRVEKFDVGQLVVATPAPCSIFLAVAADGNHGNGVGIRTDEKSVGLDETRSQYTTRIDGHRPYHGRVGHVDAPCVQGARRRRRIPIQRVVNVVSSRHRELYRHRSIVMARFHAEQRIGGIPIHHVGPIGVLWRGVQTHTPCRRAI